LCSTTAATGLRQILISRQLVMDSRPIKEVELQIVTRGLKLDVVYSQKSVKCKRK
jgi:hypothetical protein